MRADAECLESSVSAVIDNGRLYLVATPIGCLEDITLRALRVLKEVDLIAAEDTRRAKILLNHYGIATPVTPYHEHNERLRTSDLIERLLKGRRVALISDAGTPCLSDPGYVLVREAIRRGIPVEPVPGPNAAVSALIVSGAPVHRFVFEGFLPSRAMARRRRLEEIAACYSDITVILFESPHRLVASMRDIAAVMGRRYVAVCRELTKRFETCLRGEAVELAAALAGRPVKGECVIVIAPQGFQGPG